MSEFHDYFTTRQVRIGKEDATAYQVLHVLGPEDKHPTVIGTYQSHLAALDLCAALNGGRAAVRYAWLERMPSVDPADVVHPLTDAS